MFCSSIKIEEILMFGSSVKNTYIVLTKNNIANLSLGDRKCLISSIIVNKMMIELQIIIKLKGPDFNSLLIR